MRRTVGFSFVLLLAACSSSAAGPAGPVGGVDGDGGDAGIASDAGVEAAAPDGAPVSGLYRSPSMFEVESSQFLDEVTYTDALGGPRKVPFMVYRPKGQTAPAPVILLSHGGATGKTSPLKSMDKWGPVLASAGYVAIAMAHSLRAPADYEALCAHLDVPAITDYRCAIRINWDRPDDVSAVLDWLEAHATEAPWAGMIDLRSVAHMGHSAGGGAAMMLGGVTREYVCGQPFGGGQGTVVACDATRLQSKRDKRISAVIAFSPQGPDTDGFMSQSYAKLEVPFLMGSGTSDGDPGEPASRVALFPLLPAAVPHYKVYIEDIAAKHTVFEGEIEACIPLASEARCIEMRSWLFATTLAFVDANLRHLPAARAWLASEALEGASAGTATLVDR